MNGEGCAWVVLTDAQLRDELSRATQVLLTPREKLKKSRLATLAEQQTVATECRARLAALQVIRQFAAADTVARPQAMRYMCTIVKAALLEQLRQPRAALVAAACEVVLTLATCTRARAAWTLMSSWFVAALLRCTASTHATVVTAARAALDASVMRPGLSRAALVDILTACHAAHHRVRTHALRTLLTLLRHVKGTSEELTTVALYSVPLRHVIRQACSDADALVRRLARMCFWALYAVSPHIADELRGSLTSKLQQLLLREKDTAMDHIGVFAVSTKDAPFVAAHTLNDTQCEAMPQLSRTCTPARRETGNVVAAAGVYQASASSTSRTALHPASGCADGEYTSRRGTSEGGNLHDELRAITAQEVRRTGSARNVPFPVRHTTESPAGLARAGGGLNVPATPRVRSGNAVERTARYDEVPRRGSRDAVQRGKDDDAQRRVLSLVAALHAARDTQERCSMLERCVDALWQRPYEWGDEACDGLLVCLDLCGSEAHEPSHVLRRRSFAALRAILRAPAMPLRLPSLARQLTRVLLLCRAGLDDAYAEVQQEAALALHAVLVEAGLPRDMCVHGLVTCLTRWQHGLARDDATVGRLALLNALGRCLFAATAVTHGDVLSHGVAHMSRRTEGDEWLSDVVVQRTVALMDSLQTHPAPRVRQSASRVAAFLQRACQSHSALLTSA